MTDLVALKPCPFCDGPVHRRQVESVDACFHIAAPHCPVTSNRLMTVAQWNARALEQSTLEIKEYREALECISVISTNHGGWFENGSWEWGQMMGRIAGEALSRAALNHHEGSEG